MNYSKINEVLSDLSEYTLKRKYKVIETKQSDDYFEEKDQGDVGVKENVYELGFDDMFLKVTYNSDSYGDNETVKSVQFVKAKVVQTIIYEPITE